MAPQRRSDHVDEAGVEQIRRRDVHRHSQPGPGCAPGGALRESLLEHEPRERPHEPGLLGERQELQRRDHAETRMGPAQQRLDGDGLAGPQVDLRLVVQDQLLGVDGGTQLVDEDEAVAAVVDVRLVHLERALAELGPVHRDVGAAHEADAVGGVGRRHRDADAAR